MSNVELEEKDVEPPVPSLAIILNRELITKLEDVLERRMDVYKLQFLNAVKIPDISSAGHKILNLCVSELNHNTPNIDIIPDTGLRIQQKIDPITVKGDYKKTVLVVPVNQSFALTTSLTLDLTVGLNGSPEHNKLTIEIKTFEMNFHSLDLDLNKNPILSEICSLFPSINESIKGAIEKSIRAVLDSSFNGIDVMENMPISNESEGNAIRPEVVFKADRVEFYARLPWEECIRFIAWHDPGNAPALPYGGARMVYLIVAKKIVEIIIGEENSHNLKRLMKVKKCLPKVIYRKGEKYVTKKLLPPFLYNVHFKSKGDFFLVHFDLQLDGLIDEIEDVVSRNNANQETGVDSEQ